MFPKVVLIDLNSDIIMAWKTFFRDKNVDIVHTSFKDYMDTHYNEVDAIVSPANSFGLMDGGYDLAIKEYFGDALQRAVQKVIQEKCYGEQVVGTAISVPIPKTDKILIHSPTMRVPSIIQDANVIYSCMKSTLMEAINNKVKCILIPAFGGLTGRVMPDVVARKMWGAYVQLKMPNKEIIGWESVIDYTDELLWNEFDRFE